ncbi:MAG: hypothetical protein JOZ69_23750 [Myxococcales bacterium]|nr:hypothetical protein [Myxococcales bacterium]
MIPAEAAEEPAIRQAIEDVIGVMGSVPDRSGKPGVDQAKVDAFFERARARADWLEVGARDPAVRALGEIGGPAAAALQAVRAKVDDYFVRGRLLALDGKAIESVGAPEGDAADLAGQELGPDDARVAKWPLARIEASRPLPLSGPVNPAWGPKLAAFAQATVAPLIGPRTSLSEGDWAVVQERLQPYLSWLARRPDADLGKLSDERVTILARSGAAQAISDLIARDLALASENAQIEAVERMIRVRRDFVELLRNFVNFADFYAKRRAVFQSGTLYIDGRSCDLCLPVADVAKHASLAGLAKAYLAYCDCVRRKDAEKRTIVAVVTAGETDNLMVGRNGVFYDRKGDDWDATITRIVENPISVRQAFWAPYKRFVRLVEDQVAKRAGAADELSGKRLQTGALELANADQHKPEPPPGPKPTALERKIDVGTVAAIGVAIGGIATFLSSVLATFLGLGMWMPIGVIALVLAISGPSMLIAWLKLRQRNIGPILDANGWAVNGFARINVPFGAALTAVGRLPVGASRSLQDPFAEEPAPWGTYVTLAAFVLLGGLWFFGKFDPYLPESAKASAVLHRTPPPAAPAPAPAAPGAGVVPANR